ncbi:MAG TPA: hypothetical protein VNE21_03045 [Mycobacteriales bacterium]|nr:hypothetical protein [Mycobacteriales bacterium]
MLRLTDSTGRCRVPRRARRLRPLPAVLGCALVVTACATPAPTRAYLVVTPAVTGNAVSLTTAAAVERQRLAHLATGATVTVQNGRLVVSVPIGFARFLPGLARTGRLALRPVLASHNVHQRVPRPNLVPLAVGLAYVQQQCPPAAPMDSEARQVVACDAQGSRVYLLGRAIARNGDIASATALSSPAGQPVVSISLTPTVRAQFGLDTRFFAQQPAPRNELAVVIDGLVASAPRVTAAITNGELQISGAFTADQALELAALFAEPPLPEPMREGTVLDHAP